MSTKVFDVTQVKIVFGISVTFPDKETHWPLIVGTTMKDSYKEVLAGVIVLQLNRVGPNNNPLWSPSDFFFSPHQIGLPKFLPKGPAGRRLRDFFFHMGISPRFSSNSASIFQRVLFDSKGWCFSAPQTSSMTRTLWKIQVRFSCPVFEKRRTSISIPIASMYGFYLLTWKP